MRVMKLPFLRAALVCFLFSLLGFSYLQNNHNKELPMSIEIKAEDRPTPTENYPYLGISSIAESIVLFLKPGKCVTLVVADGWALSPIGNVQENIDEKHFTRYNGILSISNNP